MPVDLTKLTDEQLDAYQSLRSSGAKDGTPKPNSFISGARSFFSGVGDTMWNALKGIPQIQGLGGGNLPALNEPKSDRRGASDEWGAAPNVDILSDVRPLINTFKTDPARAAGQVAPMVIGEAAPPLARLAGRAVPSTVSLGNFGGAPASAPAAAESTAPTPPRFGMSPSDAFTALLHPRRAIAGLVRNSISDALDGEPAATGAAPAKIKPLAIGEMKSAVRRGAMKPDQFESVLRGQGFGQGEASLIRENLDAEMQPKPTPIQGPQAPAPFRPNPNISKRYQQSGSAAPFDPTADLQAHPPLPRRGFAPPEPEPAAPVVPPQAPAPFRPNSNIAKRYRQSGASTPFDPTDDLQSPSKPMAGAKAKGLPSGPREVVVQHKGDPRLPGRAPEDPKMFDSFGRQLPRPNRWK